MSFQVDHSRRLTAEERAYLTDWSMDWVIEENDRIHADLEAQSGAASAGDAASPEPVVSVDDSDEGEDIDPAALAAEIDELNVDELKAELRELDLPVSGNRAELRDRLLNALLKEPEPKD